MHRFLVLLLGSTGLPHSMANSADTTWFNRDSGEVVSRTIIAPPEDFSWPALEARVQMLLNDLAAGRPLVQLVVATSHEALAGTMFHGRITGDISDEETRLLIKRARLPALPTAHILVVRGRARVSVRDKAGFRKKTIGGSGDPTEFRAGRGIIHLLHIELTEPGPALAKDDYSMMVFARAEGHVSVSDVGRFVSELLTLTDVNLLILDVRKHAYFPEHWGFPALFPFQPDLALPPAAEVMKPRIACSAGKKLPIRCVGEDFAP